MPKRKRRPNFTILLEGLGLLLFCTIVVPPALIIIGLVLPFIALSKFLNRRRHMRHFKKIGRLITWEESLQLAQEGNGFFLVSIKFPGKFGNILFIDRRKLPGNFICPLPNIYAASPLEQLHKLLGDKTLIAWHDTEFLTCFRGARFIKGAPRLKHETLPAAVKFYAVTSLARLGFYIE